MTAPTLILIPSDYIRQLTESFWTRERVPDRPPYITEHAALLDQLANTLTGSTTGNDTVRGTAGARPAGRIDVLAFLERIQRESLDFAEDYGIPLLPLRPRLRRIGAVLGLQPDPIVRGWWVTARVLTSFDAAAYTPNVPCPNEDCERRGSLRVKVGEAEHERLAVCVECHTCWDGPYFGVFARWVRWASEHLRSGHLCDECITVQAEMVARQQRRALHSARRGLQSARR